MLSGLDVLSRACGCFGEYDNGSSNDHGWVPLSKATKEELYDVEAIDEPKYVEPPAWRLEKDAPIKPKVPSHTHKDSTHAT